jgi:hypothetical protein
MPEERRGPRRISRRTLRSPSSVEAYLQAGVIPRFIERARQIEDETQRQRLQLERAYEWMRGKYADDPSAFAEHWAGMARRWSFADVNELIEQHNNWYPAERRLPLNPRTGDYITIGGREWRRTPLDADWILRQFPTVI